MSIKPSRLHDPLCEHEDKRRADIARSLVANLGADVDGTNANDELAGLRLVEKEAQQGLVLGLRKNAHEIATLDNAPGVGGVTSVRLIAAYERRLFRRSVTRSPVRALVRTLVPPMK